MPDQCEAAHVLPVASLTEYFRDSLETALRRQRLAVDGHTQHYVVNVLTLFARSEALFESTPDGLRLKPLVAMLAEALTASNLAERQRALQRLGDVSLFIAGFFARSFARKLVDIDYHIAMGAQAYSTLADTERGRRGAVLGRVFAELAGKFQPLVDALNEISEGARGHTDADVLRLYEVWLRTGSRRSWQLLRGLGVLPAPAGQRAH
ncbi:MAG TPA: hypothetical protein VHW25_09265 [Steroidobacteraceae bacterium]|jgi:hypothetical protein|nr:hypothetical protein [Steroidobacteraceae bacterium]